MRLKPFLRRELTDLVGPVESRDALLRQLSERIAEAVAPVDAETMYQALIDRESKGPTSTPEGVAFPHAMIESVEGSFVGACKVNGGADFGQKGHPPSDLVFVLVGPPEAAWEHIRILARLARICHGIGALQRLRDAEDSQQLYDALVAEDERHV